MNKSAMLMTRMEPKLKKDAEKILEHLGIPASVVITSLYKQIVLRKEIPFALSLVVPPKPRSEMSEDEFTKRLCVSLAQAKAGKAELADKVLAELQKGLKDAKKV